VRRRLTPLFRSVFQDIPTEEHLVGGVRLFLLVNERETRPGLRRREPLIC
jgi:hypothetical protein